MTEQQWHNRIDFSVLDKHRREEQEFYRSYRLEISELQDVLNGLIAKNPEEAGSLSRVIAILGEYIDDLK